MHKVVVTGLGFITSIGNDKSSVLESLRELRHGIAAPAFLTEKDPIRLTGTIKDFDTSSDDVEDWTIPAPYSIRREVLRSLPAHGVYAYCAMAQAIADAGLTPEEVSNPQTGIFTASAGSSRNLHNNLKRLEKVGVMRCNPMGIVASVVGTLSYNLVAAYKIEGASCGFASACASSGHALGFAYDAIALGRQQRMFVVGAEDGDRDTILPFAAMRALSSSTDPDSASRPFDKARNGFVGTGGATVLVLESEETAKARGAKIYAEFAGWGQSSDGYNVAISHPEGLGLIRAMEIALKAAGVSPAEVDHINAHATSTQIGDASELKAIRAVFDGHRPAISSTKALTGHGLSLASAMEAGFTALALSEGFTPGSAHITELDPEAEGLNIPRQTLNNAPKVALSNSSGFGGANVSLVLKKV